MFSQANRTQSQTETRESIISYSAVSWDLWCSETNEGKWSGLIRPGGGGASESNLQYLGLTVHHLCYKEQNLICIYEAILTLSVIKNGLCLPRKLIQTH